MIGVGIDLLASPLICCLLSRAPALDVSGTLHMRPPPPDKIRAAVTQAEMTAVSVPVLEGAELDANFKVGSARLFC